MGKLFVLVLLLLLVPNLSFGDIYIFQDDEGVTHFTDSPDHSGFKLLIRTKNGNKEGNAVTVSYDTLPLTEIHKIITRTSTVNKVDPDLIRAIIMAESAYNSKAVSKKGAAGLMQLMPETARRFQVENSFDPEQNITGGVRYVKGLLDLYKGNLDYSLAAYNAGETAVYKHKGIPPFKETRNYVKKVKRFLESIKSGNGKFPYMPPT